MKNAYFAIAAIAFLVFAAGCVGEEKATGKAVAGVAERKIVKIGAPLALSGKIASLGIDAKNALELAVEEVNNNDGNFRIELVFEDTQSEIQPAVSSVKKLLEVDKVKIIMGLTRSNDVLAVAPLSEAKLAILLTSTPGSDEISNAGDFVFRNRETAALHGNKISEFLEKQGIIKVAVFTAQSANAISFSKVFSENFKKAGGEIVFSTEYNENSLDFRTEISKALENKPQAIYLAAGTGKDGAILTKQIRELGFNGLIVSTAALEAGEFLQGAGTAADGAIITSPTVDFESNAGKEFYKKYKERFNAEPTFVAVNSYDALKIIYNAIENCNGGENTECIRDYLYGVKNYPGIGGLTTFDSKGDVIKPVMLKVVKNGVFVKLE